ncbi:DUF4231 domain-containing protein [Nostoc sp. KVJ3]|uniref:DUF4231 domain-containing protein n=1 Tax=Nostoc sp. KVJ3 TaxID=457945 RepID=UPI0022379077|nr:DUF4231 domain-containing protein [Nostoc sp. KVJ3]
MSWFWHKSNRQQNTAHSIATVANNSTTGDVIINISTVKDVAKARIDEYEQEKKYNKSCYYTSQWAIIVLTGITPLLLIVPLPNIYPAISSAVASITAGLASTFKFREKYDLNKNALTCINIEVANFNCGTGNYTSNIGDENAEKNNNTLMHNIDLIDINRRHSWSGLISAVNIDNLANSNVADITPSAENKVNL